MLDHSQHDVRTTELDLALLSTPYGVHTEWHVITGAPCCGKTTLIDQLADTGFQTVPETGRAYIEQEMARGRTIDEIRQNNATFCRTIKDLQLAMELGLRARECLFLDRAFPDSLTWFRVAGLDPNQILSECFHHRYASVFLLDRFPLQQDGVRTEDDVQSDFADEWLAHDYGALGYSVVRVPVMSRAERLTFVLERLSEQGLI
jgi:predicted ATPase